MRLSGKKILLFIGLMMTGLGFAHPALADELSFVVETAPGENQIDKTKTYYDLRVTPGATEELKFTLKNTADKPITVLIDANTAVTNDNGVIDYGMSDVKKFDSTLKDPFSQITTVEHEVTLQPKESKEMAATVKIPQEPFKGIILGGLYFSQKDEEEDESNNSGVQIVNKFGYAIGVRLSENDDPVTGDMKLLDVKAGQRNYRNMILANLQNPTPKIIGKITVTADVYAAGDTSTPVYHSKQENLNMAPNSNFNYGITMNNKPFKAGKYVLKMTAVSGDKEWKFEKEFEIKSDEAKKFNDEAVELAEEPTDYTLYIILAVVAVVIVIALIVVWVIHTKRKHEAELAKAKAHKGKKSSGSSGKKKSHNNKKQGKK